jgi:hypothetical protein
VLRKSMQKAARPTYQYQYSPDGKVCLDIVSTFEPSNKRPRTLSSGNCVAKLNRWSCIFLEARGVPSEAFLELLESELQVLKCILSDAQAAESYCRRVAQGRREELQLEPPSGNEGEDIEDIDIEGDEEEEGGEGEEEGGERDGDQTGEETGDESSELLVGCPLDQWQEYTSLAAEKQKSFAEQALAFLQARHDISEPRLQFLLNKIQESELENLKHCRMRLERVQYLPGAPDPTNTLTEGEVFVSLFRGAPVHSRSFQNCIVTSRVLVMRFPLLHKDEIRMLHAVDNAALSAYCEDTCGGVIFFSTHGMRSAADEMGGGDFDGDRYMVMFCDNIFTEAVERSDAVPPPEPPPPLPPSLVGSAGPPPRDRHDQRCKGPMQ